MSSHETHLEEAQTAPPVVDSETAVDCTESAGQLLFTAREESGLSHREVADQLHVLVKQIEALEQDNYAFFTNEIFCKGYLNSYAKLLGVDSELVMQRYLELREDPVVTQAQTKQLIYLQKPHRGSAIKYWFLAASIGILSVLWWSNRADVSSTEVPATSNDVVVDQHNGAILDQLNTSIMTNQKSIEESVLVAEENIDNALNGDALVIAADNASVSDVRAESSIAQPQVDTLVEQVSTNEAVATSVLASTENMAVLKDSLSFMFAEDCWVEVRDGDDKVIYSNLKRGEQSLQLSGKAPFSVLLGYAPGVELSFNGEPVDIKVNQRNNSARFVVGRS